MPDNDIVLSAHNISKKYYTKKSSFLKKAAESDVFWALNDVSFEVRKGEILGIIGANGAGKSTILKILSEIIAPTSGHVAYRGSVLSILDIGTGFHPDLSGYENIFLNASLLGMKKKRTSEKVDEIIAFSGIADHIHEPVKTYSNGMYLRLALSIALFTDNEILLLDEVVSVGDAEFRLKAIQKIKEQAHKGKACIMISHDLGSVLELCDKCILLDKGKIIYSGASKAAVEDYFGMVYDNINRRQEAQPDHQVCNFISLAPVKEAFEMDEPVCLKIRYEVKKQEDIRVVLKIRTYHAPVMLDSLTFRPGYQPHFLQPGMYETTCMIPANLFNAGIYLVEVILGTELEMFATVEMAGRFKVTLKAWEKDRNWNQTNDVIPVRPLCDWDTVPVKRD